MATINPFDFFVEDAAASWPFTYEPVLAGELKPYLEPLPGTPLLDDYVRNVAGQSSTIAFIIELNRRLSQDIAYQVRMEPGVQAPDETLARASGSCRDSGWLLVQILRRVGLAARFVSGYLIQLRPDGGETGGPAEDFTDLHAWAEVYVPGAGWIGLDPTSGLLAGEGHIPLAATPSPTSAAPITGSLGAAEVEFSVTMQVERLHETPRVTKPYTEVQWQEILAAGAAVDARLTAGDVRLTMGGEPTFVALDDAAAPEWNYRGARSNQTRFRRQTGAGFVRAICRRRHCCTTARANGIRASRPHAGPSGFTGAATASHCGAMPALSPRRRPETPATVADAEKLAGALCRALGLSGDSAIPAYEDAAHFALVEQKLPLGVAPQDNKLAEPTERERLIRAFDRGLDKPVGYVLPLLMTQGAKRQRRLITERWAFKRGHLFLIPGDSPLGLRLPLAGLPEISFDDYPHVLPADPFAAPKDMPGVPDLVDKNSAAAPPPPAEKPEPVRTALAVELRDGHVCVFLPPLSDGADYAALIAAIEATAAKTQAAHPPRRLRATVRPAHQRHQGHARSGRHRGERAPGDVLGRGRRDHDDGLRGGRADRTGRGEVQARRPPCRHRRRQPHRGRRHHAAPTARSCGGRTCWRASSPTGRTIPRCPTCSPASSLGQPARRRGSTRRGTSRSTSSRSRCDKSPSRAAPSRPGWSIASSAICSWTSTGNTHRAEICIDKLYAPEGPMGRLGLVEFRAFEMTPHPRMSLAQQLLIRALVARFWERPYRQTAGALGDGAARPLHAAAFPAGPISRA